MDLYGKSFLVEAEAPQRDQEPDHWSWRPARPEAIRNPLASANHHPFLFPDMTNKVARDTVLLIGAVKTVHSGPIIEALRAMGTPFAVIDWDEFSDQGALNLELTDPSACVLEVAGARLCLDRIRSVYYNPPTILSEFWRRPHVVLPEERLFLSRWSEVIKDLHAFTPGARWYPGPFREVCDDAQRKLAELKRALDCGLRVPDTVVTTDPVRARAFVRKHHGRVIHREMGLRWIDFEDEEIRKTFAVALVDPEADDWQLIRESPSVFQQMIDKVCDLRVIVADEEVMACRIESQASERTQMDWRKYDDARVPYRPVELPETVGRGLIRFMKASGLRFGSFDLVVDRDGAHFFLELNRPGAWLFIENRAGLPIAETLARVMSR